MRRSVALATTLAVFVGVLVFSSPHPADAATVQGAGTVHGGMYSPEYSATGDLNALASATGKRVTFGGTFHVVNENEASDGSWSNTENVLEGVWGAQATPFANLAINGSAFSIARGDHDSKIHEWVTYLQRWLNRGGGRSLIIAPLQEMNWNGTHWSCDPGNFKIAYQRIVNIIRGRGINETKVRFAFAPNGATAPGCGSIYDYYPGDSYVDVIGISAYRWGQESVYQVMGGIVDGLAATYPTKPIVIAQTGAVPSGSKSAWIREMFSWGAAHPHVVGIIYFNINADRAWRVWNWGTGSLDPGWRDGMLYGSTAYQWPLSSWFQAGPLTLSIPPGVNLCPQGRDCDTTAFQDSGGRFKIFTYATSGAAQASFYYGNPGDVAFSGDWDCNGSETLGLYRRSDGYVYLRNSNTEGIADISFYFGNPGDLPVAGDFNGNGCDTVSIYRPSEARFYIINKLGSSDTGLGAAEYSFMFGNVGDKPFVGDFNGDGVDTIGLHRETSGLVYFRNSNTSGIADFQFIFGNPGDKLVAGDWDGNNHDTIGVYRPVNGMFYARNSNTTGVADSQVFVGSQAGVVAINP
jgi:hypothetical protein